LLISLLPFKLKGCININPNPTKANIQHR